MAALGLSRSAMLADAVVLGFALAADAFAASLARGASVRSAPHATALVLGAACGFAQALMPLIGWGFGELMGPAFEAIDHWVAFAVLAVLGARLIKETMERGGAAAPAAISAGSLIALALATSVDAAAAGVTFAPLGLEPYSTAAVIGAVTAVACGGGVYLGRAMGAALGKPAEFAGGAALILLGVKVLWDHGALAVPF
ncbi:MAG: manganese efflux pump MntP family protein [Hyphomonadaceae bacterium]